MHKLSKLQFAQVTAVLVVDEVDVVESIIILKTRKLNKSIIKNLTWSQEIPHACS